MAYYQAHVDSLCAAIGFRVSGPGKVTLEPAHAALAMEFQRTHFSTGPAASPLSFDSAIRAAICNTALEVLITDRKRSSTFARRLYDEELAAVRDVSTEVPVQVRVSQQKALATVYNTTSTAMMLMGPQSQGL
jgi:hypothetical protein